MKKVFSQFYARMKAGYEVDHAWRAWKYAKEQLDKKKTEAAHVQHMKAVARMALLCKPRGRRRKDGNELGRKYMDAIRKEEAIDGNVEPKV